MQWGVLLNPFGMLGVLIGLYAAFVVDRLRTTKSQDPYQESQITNRYH